MPRTYADLKSQLGIAERPFLSAFERYCQDMQNNTRVLEWSCKLFKDRLEGARFLHTARHPEFEKAQYAVERLFDFLGRSSVGALQDAFFAELPSLATRVGQGIALGYAENHIAGESSSELKLYIATSRIAEVRPVIERLVPVGGMCPLSTRRVMIAASVNERFACGSRVYYLWERSLLTQPGLQTWLRQWCTPEEMALIASSATATLSVAFKQASRDMIYLSAPFHGDQLNQFIVKRLEDHPALSIELGDLRWIGFSKHREGLNCDELNVYFSSVFS
jgi:hypothetical protein